MPAKMKFPRILTEEEVARMMHAAEKSGRTGRRDLMLLKCLYYLGLKSSELVNMHTDDIDFEKNVVLIGNDNIREVMIPGAFTFELEKFIEGRKRKYGLNREHETLNSLLVFPGRAEGKLSDRHIRRIVKHYARLANVRNYEEVKPHTLRVSYATHLRKEGVPVKAIQEMLGHARRETTYMYTHGMSKVEISEDSTPEEGD